MYTDNFSWIERIKVALEFAKLLEYLHNGERPYMVFNIDSTNIMLDQVGFDVAFLSLETLKFPPLFIIVKCSKTCLLLGMQSSTDRLWAA